MDNYDNEFDEIEGAAADRRKQQDFDDLQNEMSGNEVGRISRFLSADARALIAEKQGKPSRVMNALEMALMNNPTYRALYKAAVDETRATQILTQKFQDDIEVALAKVNVKIERVLDDAITLPDGRKAFMDKDGAAWTARGKPVDKAIAAGINWDGTVPREAYQDLLSRKDILEHASSRGEELSLRLGDIYNDLHDENEPPSSEKIEAYREEIKMIETELNSSRDTLNIKTDNTSIGNDATPDITALNQNVVPTL